MANRNDKITTVLGAVGAGITAATPIINAAQGTALQKQDYVQLAFAVVMAVFGFFTNKKEKQA